MNENSPPVSFNLATGTTGVSVGPADGVEGGTAFSASTDEHLPLKEELTTCFARLRITSDY